jgi:superfamily I DNA/RNA helicase
MILATIRTMILVTIRTMILVTIRTMILVTIRIRTITTKTTATLTTKKTILAIEQAMRLASDGSRVGLLCYNRGLGEFLKRSVEKLDQAKKPSLVGNILDDLVARWKIQGPPTAGSKEEVSNYYQEFLPNALLTHAAGLQDHQKFDAWVVDEAQDLQPAHWELLQASLRDPENGMIHVFGDKDQNLFAGATELPWFYAIGRLNRNLRSSRAIARSLNELSDSDNEPSGIIQGMPPEILLVDNRDEAEQVANSYVEFLIESVGWRPQDIAVITTRQRHAIHESLKDDSTKYWDQYFANDSVFYTHVSSFKGLERPVVVVVVNGIPFGSEANQQLYVAMSRARDDLVLVGAKEELGHLGELFDKFPKIEL